MSKIRITYLHFAVAAGSEDMVLEADDGRNIAQVFIGLGCRFLQNSGHFLFASFYSTLCDSLGGITHKFLTMIRDDCDTK